MIKNQKRGTIGATLTWVVATLIIFMVVIIFVYASLGLAGEKQIKNSIRDSDNSIYSDVDSEKMLLSILELNISGESIREIVIKKEYDKLNEDIFRRDVLTRLPEKGNDGWYILINNNGVVTDINPAGGLIIGDNMARVSEVYLNKEIKISLYLNSPYDYGI